MREKIVNVYKFHELSDSAKEVALADYMRDENYNWASEAMDSIKALAVHFGGKLLDWSVDWMNPGQSWLTFGMPDMSQKEIRQRLKQLGTYNLRTGRGHGECKLTGYCADECAIDGFRLAWRGGERNLMELMRAAGEEWLSSCCADAEHQFSTEGYAESCEANGYEFYEDGSMV